MEPILKKDDKLLVSVFSYGAYTPFFKKRLGLNCLPKRGEIVIIVPPYVKELSFWERAANTIVDFFTLHRKTIIRDAAGKTYNQYMAKRIIGMPGDSIFIKNYVAYIKPRGETKYIAETQLIKKDYSINTKIPAEKWDSNLPFSGNMHPITLKNNQYFVLGDNRPFSSDSRSWGIITYKNIVGKVILKYWPIDRFGKLQ